MGQERVATNVLRWETDRAALNATIAAARQIEKSQEDVARSNEIIARTAKEAGVSQEALARAAATQVKGGDSDIVGRADTATSALATLASSMDFAGAEALGVAGDVLGLIDAWNMMKTAALANQGATTAATGGIAGMTAALAPVLTILAPIAGVAAALAGALALARNAYEENQRAAEVAANAIVKYNEAIADGTTEKITEQLEQANRDLEVATKTRDDLLAAQAKAWAEESGYILGDLGARVRTALGASVEGAEKYNDLITEQEKAILEAESAVRGLNDALGSTEVAANDAAEVASKSFAKAFEGVERYWNKVVDEQEKAIGIAIDAAQRSADTEIERARILRTASQESIDAAIEEEQLRIAAIEQELEALRKLPQGSEEVRQAIAETSGELADAKDQLNFLEGAATDAAKANDQLATAEQRLGEIASETDAALRQIEQSDKKIADTQKRIADLETKTAEQREAVNEQLAKDLAAIDERIAQDAKEHKEKLADIERDYNAEMAKLAQDAAKAAEDNARTLTKIEQNRIDAIADVSRDIVKYNQEQAFENQKAEKQALANIAKVREDWRREQLRAEEDLSFNLNEAVLARDVDSVIRLQRQFATESQRRAEDAQDELSEIAQQRQERIEEAAFERQMQAEEFQYRIQQIKQQAAEERAEAQRQFQERIADIQAQAAAAREARNQAIAEEQAAFAERQAIREQERAAARQAAAERIQQINEQSAAQIEILNQQIETELEIRESALKEIEKLENERTRIAAGDIDNIVLAEERLAEARQRSVDQLMTATENFQNQGFQNLQNFAVSFGNITTTLVANVQGSLQAAANQALSQVSSGLNNAVSQAATILGTSGVGYRVR